MYVLATAGHVDHGKSTLVRALTGSEPDRLAEERRRGLSIALGYCWTTLPGVGEVAFVDVPGHERFIATTLSGLGPVPAVMFVVAADDPWMPQAAEHLQALDALGVQHGVLVVTRADLADPAPALSRARERLSRTSLAGVAAVAVSARTGAGLDELRAVLGSALSALPEPQSEGDVRLWIDRRFHAHGSGTVITGTLTQGTIAVGDRLCVDDGVVRVRGLECLGEPVDSARGVARVALNLSGKAEQAVTHSSAVVAVNAFEQVSVIDVRFRGTRGRLPEKPILHVGSTAQSVHARPLGSDLARLTLHRALPLRIGDSAILRDPGDRRLWGVDVLDASPAPLDRRGAAGARAQLLTALDGSLGSQLAMRGLVRLSLLRRLGIATEPLPAGTVRSGDWIVDRARAAELRSALVSALAVPVEGHRSGLTPQQASRLLELPDPEIVLALVTAPVRLASGLLNLDGTQPRQLTPALDSALRQLEQDLEQDPFAAPQAARLTALGLDEDALNQLHCTGHLLRLARGVVLLPGADALAVATLSELEQPFTASAARRALDTSRRVVLPLLSHLDRTGRTVRLPDDRRRLRGLAAWP